MSADLHTLADLLDRDDVFDFVAGVIAEARESAPRVRDADGWPADRDSGEVLEDVVRALRSAQ